MGSGYQPAEVHSARMPLSWVSVTWILGDEPRPEGRDSSSDPAATVAASEVLQVFSRFYESEREMGVGLRKKPEASY